MQNFNINGEKLSPFELARYFYKRYSFLGIFILILNICYTKVFWPKFKLLRIPFHIRNQGKIIGGCDLISGRGLIIDILSTSACLRLGKNIRLSNNVHIGCIKSVSIGDDVLIASNVYISDHSHGVYKNKSQSNPLVPPNLRPLSSSEVRIGDRCWLGENVCVLQGVTIGSGSVIGAGAVVTSDIPENSIAFGVPARVAKRWNAENLEWVTL